MEGGEVLKGVGHSPIPQLDGAGSGNGVDFSTDDEIGTSSIKMSAADFQKLLDFVDKHYNDDKKVAKSDTLENAEKTTLEDTAAGH